MRIKLFGRYYQLLRPRLNAELDGKCDSPVTPGKVIKVKRSLRGQRELEVLIHEMLHACDFHKDEEWVTTAACDIMRVLWRLGYRKDGEKGETP